MDHFTKLSPHFAEDHRVTGVLGDCVTAGRWTHYATPSVGAVADFGYKGRMSTPEDNEWRLQKIVIGLTALLLLALVSGVFNPLFAAMG